MKNLITTNLVQLQINLQLILDFELVNCTCETTLMIVMQRSKGLCGFLCTI